MLTGDYFEWFDDGKAKETGVYDKDRKVGTWTFYYENGSKFEEVNFKKGLQEGSKTSWYNFGGVWTKGQFSGGKMDGKWKTYDKKGKLASTVIYKKAQLVKEE